MRRSASQIISNLERRIARLEKNASRTDVLETLKKLVKTPFGKASYPKNNNSYYFSNFKNGATVLSEVIIDADDDNDYEGKLRSRMFFNVASVINEDEDVNVRKVQSELEKEVKRLISKSSLLKEKAREEMDDESEYAFSSAWYDTRHYGFSYGSDGDLQVSVKVKKERNLVKAEIKVSQEFDFELKGELGDDVI